MQAFQLMRVGAVLITGILLTKTGLAPAAIGEYELLLYIGATVVFLGVNGLLQGISPVYIRSDDNDRKRLLFQVFLVFSALAVTVFTLFWGGRAWIVPMLTGQSALSYFNLYCVFLLLNIPTLPVEIIYLLKQKPWHLVIWGIVSFGCQVIVVCLPAILGWGLEAAIWGLVFLSALKLVWTFRVILQYATPVYDKVLLGIYFALAFPLVINTLTGNLIGLFDNWLVAHRFNDAAQFALFRYGSREFPLALALATALGTTLIPRIAEHRDRGMAELKIRSLRLFHAVFPLSIVLALSTIWWFPKVFNPDFSVAAPLFRLSILITISRVVLPNSILIGLGNTRVLFQVSLLELAFKIVSGYLFIQWWGLTGVIWSMVLSCWLEKAVLMYYLYRRYQITPAQWLDWRWLVGYSVLLLFSVLL